MSWENEVDELRRRQAMAEAMGGAEGVARQRRQGKLTVRSASPHSPIPAASASSWRCRAPASMRTAS